MKKRILTTGCAFLAAMAMSLCAGAAEDELVLYTWEGMFPQEILDGFEEEYGIKITYSNFDLDETMLTELYRTGGGEYDLVIADDYIIEQAVEAGLVQEINKDIVTNFDNINSLYQGQFYDPDDLYTVPYGAGVMAIVYDPAYVDIEITGYNSLWDESLVDSLALPENYRVVIGAALLSLGYDMNEEDEDLIAEAGEKLLALADNVHAFQDSNMQNLLLNGEASVAFMYYSQVTMALLEDPSLEVVYPEEGLGFGIMGAFIPSNAPHAEAANLFLNYILEPENAAACMNWIGYYNTIEAADELVDASLVADPEIFTADAIYIVENISSDADAAYQEAWLNFVDACN